MKRKLIFFLSLYLFCLSNAMNKNPVVNLNEYKLPKKSYMYKVLETILDCETAFDKKNIYYVSFENNNQMHITTSDSNEFLTWRKDYRAFYKGFIKIFKSYFIIYGTMPLNISQYKSTNIEQFKVNLIVPIFEPTIWDFKLTNKGYILINYVKYG